ncbi:MAG: Fe-S cluster assembly protein SufD [Candidatus Caldarchaeum sp.]|nr:Fe-S cluster assembly protein SufD [Candidatus Caldarchaeum sp.]
MTELPSLASERFRGEPEWLSRLRVKFLELYRAMPPETSELYVRHYEAPELVEDKLYSMLTDGAEADVPSEFKHVKDDEEHPTAVFVGGRLAHLHLPAELGHKNVEVLTIGEALKRHEPFMRELLNRTLNSRYLDKYSSLVHALLTSGTFIRMPKSTVLDKPFRIIYIFNKPSEAFFSKTVVVAEPMSSASVVEELHGLPGSAGCVAGQHVELVLDESSSIRHGVLQNLGHDHTYLANRISLIGRNSSAMVVGSLIGGGMSKVRVDNVMAGDGSSVNDLELVFGDGDQKMDLTANLHHVGYGTQGKEVAKGVVKEKARVIFKGMITIEKKAKNTNAYLAKHAMIMSPEARAYAIPSLEIETDEVKATHSASVSQIDPDQIYYLMTRGIPYEEARKMLALAFFEPVVSMIDLDEVRWGLRSLLESKWGGAVSELFEEPEVTVSSLFGTHYKYRYGK